MNTEQDVPEVLFIMPYMMVLSFQSVEEIPNKTYWPVLLVVLFIMLFKVVITFQCVDIDTAVMLCKIKLHISVLNSDSLGSEWSSLEMIVQSTFTCFVFAYIPPVDATLVPYSPHFIFQTLTCETKKQCYYCVMG